jgi:hypothetical protein
LVRGFNSSKKRHRAGGGCRLGGVPGFLIAGLLVLLSGTADADVLPKSIRGLWGFEAADCANPGSDGLLKIGANTVKFFASAHDIKRVARRSDGSLRASGFVSNEGEQGRDRGSLTLKLISPDRLHVLDHTYHRCLN